MGEASRRKKALENWKATLSHDEIKIYDLTEKLLSKYVYPYQASKMCYRLAYLVYKLAKEELGLNVEVVIGYADDGDGLEFSHAWCEFNDKKIDLSLGFINPDLEDGKKGDVVILDRVIVKGQAKYTYLRKRTEAGLRKIEELEKNEFFKKASQKKETEHQMMLNLLDNDDKIANHLDNFQDGFTSFRIKEIIGI